MKHTVEYLKLRLGRPIDEEGATAVEYGIMVALIAVVIIAAVLFLGNTLFELFSDVAETIDQAGEGG